MVRSQRVSRTRQCLACQCTALLLSSRPCRVLPPRVSEIIGVQHMKLYLFDDTGASDFAAV